MPKLTGLRCKVSKGQFNDEYAVRGNDYRGDEFSFFVNEQFVNLQGDQIDANEVDAVLTVTCLKQEGDLVLIRLPGQTFSNGSTITVRASELATACHLEPA